MKIETPTASRLTISEDLRVYLILFAGVFAFGFSAIFARWAAAEAPMFVVGTWRVSVASLLLVVPFLRQPVEKRQLDRGMWRWVLIGGTIFGLSVLLFHISLAYTTAANATFIANLAPIWVGLITLFVLHRALPRLFWPGVAVALAGAALIVFGKEGLTGLRLGDVIVFGNSTIWASYQVLTGEMRGRLGTLTWVWLVVTIAAVWLVISALLLGHRLLGYGLTTTVAMLCSGLISQGAGFMAFNYALGRLPASRVSVANLFQPVVTAIAAAILLSEPFTGWRLVGGLLILAGIYLVNMRRKQAAD